MLEETEKQELDLNNIRKGKQKNILCNNRGLKQGIKYKKIKKLTSIKHYVDLYLHVGANCGYYVSKLEVRSV